VATLRCFSSQLGTTRAGCAFKYREKAPGLAKNLEVCYTGGVIGLAEKFAGRRTSFINIRKLGTK